MEKEVGVKKPLSLLHFVSVCLSFCLSTQQGEYSKTGGKMAQYCFILCQKMPLGLHSSWAYTYTRSQRLLRKLVGIQR
jgi:hypothetical protein